MAEGVKGGGQNLARASDEHAAGRPLSAGSHASSSRRPARRLTPHSHKFLVATAMLVGIAVGAIIVAVLVAATPKQTGSTAAWSSWSPPDGGLAGEREIADEVSPFYRATPGTQLVVVTVANITGPTSSGSGSGNEIALRDPSTGALSAIGGNTAVYNLCGLSNGCSIAGSPSSARFLLLRREALELALYTFRYISGVKNVVAILPPSQSSVQTCTGICAQPNPPKTTKTVNLAVVFQRDSLQRFLQQPLHDTLPEPLPPSTAEMDKAPEAELVSVITGTALFQQQRVQSQDGSNVLVLSPQPAQ
jgi:hypothetical protein